MSFFDLPPILERMLLVSDKISDLNFSVGQLCCAFLISSATLRNSEMV